MEEMLQITSRWKDTRVMIDYNEETLRNFCGKK